MRSGRRLLTQQRPPHFPCFWRFWRRRPGLERAPRPALQPVCRCPRQAFDGPPRCCEVYTMCTRLNSSLMSIQMRCLPWKKPALCWPAGTGPRFASALLASRSRPRLIIQRWPQAFQTSSSVQGPCHVQTSPCATPDSEHAEVGGIADTERETRSSHRS